MPASYSVRLNKEYLVFSAAHFITFNGDVCERLHGHNYRVEAEVFGPLDENHYVIDFIALRDRLIEFLHELDHHVLLPTKHPLIQVRTEADEVVTTFRERRWIFPLGDCVLLPVENTTAEQLAAHLGQKLWDWIEQSGVCAATGLRVAVDENFGQWGVWRFEK